MSSLRNAYRAYGVSKRKALEKTREGIRADNQFSAIGNTLMAGAKLYATHVSPNVKEWKNVERGQEALGVAESEKFTPSFWEKNFKSVDDVTMDNDFSIKSDGRSYNLSDIKGYGSALKSQSPEMRALLASHEDKEMKDFFGTAIKDYKKPQEITLDRDIKGLGKKGEAIKGTIGEVKAPEPRKMTDNLEEQMNKYGSYESMYEEGYAKVGRGLDKKGNYKKQSITDRLFGHLDRDTGKRMKTEKDYESFFRKKEMEQFTIDTEQKAAAYKKKQISNKEAIQQGALQNIAKDKYKTTLNLIKQDFPNEYQSMLDNNALESLKTPEQLNDFYKTLKTGGSKPETPIVKNNESAVVSSYDRSSEQNIELMENLMGSPMSELTSQKGDFSGMTVREMWDKSFLGEEYGNWNTSGALNKRKTYWEEMQDNLAQGLNNNFSTQG